MFREEKMKGERELDKYPSETQTPHLTSTNNHHHYHNHNHNHHHQQQQMLKGPAVSSTSGGFCFSDVGSSSLTLPHFDHSHSHEFSTPRTPIVGSTTSLPPDSSCSSWYRRGSITNNGGVILDELGLAREFHKISLENSTEDNNIGRFGRDPDVSFYNVPTIRASNADNFQGFANGYSGSASGPAGFPSPPYGDERNFKNDTTINFRLGQRGAIANVGDSLDSILAQNHSNPPYSGFGLGHQNCLINFPLEETTTLHRDDFYGNGLPVLRPNKCYDDGLPLHKSNDFLGHGIPVHRVPENTSNGGLLHKGGEGGGGGYGNEIPLQVQSMYGPHLVGDSLQMEGCEEVLNPWACSQSLPLYSPYSDEALLQHCGGQFCGNVGSLNSLNSSQLIYSKQALSRGSVLYNSTREKMRVAEEREGPQSVALMKRVRQLKPYGSESTYIIKEKGLSGAIGKSGQSSGRAKNCLTGTVMQKIGDSHRSLELNGQLQSERTCGSGSHLISCDPGILQSIYNSLAEVQGNIYLMAKDQHGCRFLQKKFDEGSFEDVQLIFNEIIDHVVELMMNPFGNYLIQKLLDVCNEEQRMKIVHVVTRDRGELVRISLNTHGTRVVQKLIESLKTKKQISLVIRALEPGFLDLIKDLNGNHVVQRCLQCLSSEENKFIFDAAAKFCVEIATHRHGCCVLQRCIAHSNGEQRKKLVEEICHNGLNLAQDPFGNYVVQYIIEQKIPSASAQLITQFEGHYVHLSMQKFSSHVVEKCLKFIEDSQPRIVYELLSVSHFEQLLQDPFANYVIQSALEVTKGSLNDSLVAAVRPHSILRTNPYCKKIFTRGLLKK